MLPRYFTFGLIATALLSLYVLYGRVQVESHNHAVSIAAEYELLEPMAAAEGLTTDEALQILKTEGLRSVVLSEEIAGEFASAGRLAAREAKQADGSSGVLVSSTPATYERILRAIKIRYPVLTRPRLMPDGTLWLPGLTSAMFKALSLGLDPRAAQRVTAAGLQVIARMGNPIGISSAGVRGTIQWAADNHAQIFLPQGDQVLGRREAMPALYQSLKDNNMLYASPEFAKMGGDINVLEGAPELVVRLHSAQSAELDKLTLSGAIDRYARAARERNMRVLLLRPVNNAGDRPLRNFGTFVQKVGKIVVKQGGKLEPPHAFTQPKTPAFAYALLGLSLIPAVYFLFSGLPGPYSAYSALLALALGIACYSPHFRQYSALLGAITMPIVAFRALDPMRSWASNYLMAVGISLLGGLLVAALLSSLPYYIRAAEFPGVKVAVFLPIVVIGVTFFHRLSDSKAAWNSPITWGTLILSLVLLGVLAFMLERTGNDNPAAVSGTELKFRDILDNVLFVRPRTKSFLIGFPMLFVGIGMLRRWPKVIAKVPSYGAWTSLVLMLGAIGATDVVNTLCHIHTPVLLSVVRIGIAAILGTAIGAILWAVAEKFLPNSIWARSESSSDARLGSA
jgi:hypothetical protein